MNLTAGIYARTSNVDRVSTKTQVQRCRAYVPVVMERLSQEMGRPVSIEVGQDLIFVDRAKSGRTFDRPEFQRLKDAIRVGQVQILLIWAMDRLGRSDDPTDMMLERRFCIEQGVRAFAEVERFEITSDDDGDLLRFFFASLQARTELRRIRERTKRNRLSTWEKDPQRWAFGGIPPFGYGLDEDKHLQVAPREAEIWQSMLDWALEGLSYGEIKMRLNRSHTPTSTMLRGQRERARWSTSGVRRLLNDPVYMGSGVEVHITDDDTDEKRVVTIPAPAITTPERFHAARRSLARRGRVRRRRHSYLLRGVLMCAECRQGFVCSSGGGGQYYACRTRQYARQWGVAACSMPSVRARAMEGPIWQDLRQVVARPVVLKEAMQDAGTRQLWRLNARLAEVERLLVANRAGLERLALDWALDMLGEDSVEPATASLRAELDALEKERIELEWGRAAVQQQEHRMQRLAALSPEALDRLPPDGRQALVQELVDQVEVERLDEEHLQATVHYHLLGADVLISDKLTRELGTYTTAPLVISI